MAVMKGKCVVCGVDDIEVNEITEECLTCIRLKHLEEDVEKLKRISHPIGPNDIVLD